MQGMGAGADGEDCPFAFNFDAATFKIGDVVSYRVVGDATLQDMPFVGELVEVHDDYVVLLPDSSNPDVRYRGTRESRPEVSADQI